MSRAIFVNGTEPTTPDTGKTTLFVSSADGHFKQKDDSGNVLDLAKNSDLTIADDGTYIKFTYDGTDLFKIRKSDGQLLIAGGLSTDESL